MSAFLILWFWFLFLTKTYCVVSNWRWNCVISRTLIYSVENLDLGQWFLLVSFDFTFGFFVALLLSTGHFCYYTLVLFRHSPALFNCSPLCRIVFVLHYFFYFRCRQLSNCTVLYWVVLVLHLFSSFTAVANGIELRCPLLFFSGYFWFLKWTVVGHFSLDSTRCLTPDYVLNNSFDLSLT